MTTKQQSQRNRIRALYQSGFGKRDISRLVGVPYREVNLAIGDTRVLTEVERAAVKLLKAKHIPRECKHLYKTWDEYRNAVEMVFGNVSEV